MEGNMTKQSIDGSVKYNESRKLFIPYEELGRLHRDIWKTDEPVQRDLELALKHQQNESVEEVKHYSEKLKEDIIVEFSSLSDKLKSLDKRKISDEDVKDFQKMSDILIKYLPNLKYPYSEIDHILYKNGTLQVDEPEKKFLIDPEELLANVDVHDFSHGYLCMVKYKNIVDQCIDNAFLKLVEHSARSKTWHLDRMILKFLESKIMYRICIGLKIFKTNFYANGFKDCIEQSLCYAVSDLSKIPKFVDQDENEMARFVAKHAKDCHDLIEKIDHLPAYRAHDIFMEIEDGKKIGQYEIRALYGLIKAGESLCGYLYENGLNCMIVAVVDNFLDYIRRFYMRYEELDTEMREIDKHNGQEFGGFSLVANDDMICASGGLGKSTLNKYFFYDDAMKTLSLLSFLYNYVENLDKDELQHFKDTGYVTQFVITSIRQCVLKNKIDRPIWIMEKILNTCHFVVFGPDEEKEKDIFLKLMNRKIDEEELSCLKDFMRKNELRFKDVWPHSEECKSANGEKKAFEYETKNDLLHEDIYLLSEEYEYEESIDLTSQLEYAEMLSHLNDDFLNKFENEKPLYESEFALELDLKLDLIHEQDDSMVKVKHHSEKLESTNDLIQLRDISESKSKGQSVVSGENGALLKYEMKQLEFEDAECVKMEDKKVETIDSSKSECAFDKLILGWEDYL